MVRECRGRRCRARGNGGSLGVGWSRGWVVGWVGGWVLGDSFTAKSRRAQRGRGGGRAGLERCQIVLRMGGAAAAHRGRMGEGRARQAESSLGGPVRI